MSIPTYIRGLSADDSGNLYVTTREQIQKFDQDMTLIDTMDFNIRFDSMTGDKDGNIYVLTNNRDADCEQLIKYDPEGNLVTSWDYYSYLQAFTVDDNGNIYILDGYTYDILVIKDHTLTYAAGSNGTLAGNTSQRVYNTDDGSAVICSTGGGLPFCKMER